MLPGKKTYERIVAKQALNRVKAERMPFEWSLNPYRGCAHGCSFCYARAFQSFIGMEANDEFQNHIFLKENIAEALEAQLSRMARSRRLPPGRTGPFFGTVAIGTATDPYQPAEGKAGLTRACLEVLAKYRVRTSITTRSPLILRDTALLRTMNLASVNISINTLDDALTRKLEPATPLPRQRLDTVAALAAEGIPVGLFIAPILPLLTDDEETLDALFAAGKEAFAGFAMTSLLRLSPDVKPWYFGTLETHFPELIGAYARLYGKDVYADRRYAEQLNARLELLRGKYGLLDSFPEDAPVPPPEPPYAPPPAEQISFSF
ncbi:radical SAM protein [Paenibacillus sp. TRM 82003]|nr:radical SAM protein [Paenibacillus sp. TRM 82003]